MTELALNGLRILVLEDDYYLATDIKTVIEGAGGRVIGPFGTAEEARSAFDAEGADLAVVDINLGQGPVFDFARHLVSARLPFLFATGYDQSVVPDDLRAVVRLEKPFCPAALVAAAATANEAANAGGR